MTDKQININKKLRLHFFLLMASWVPGMFLSGPPMASMETTKWIVTGLALSFFANIPLLFFVSSVLKPTPRNMSWLGFFLLAYLLAIILYFSSRSMIGGLVVSTFTITTFFYLVVWLRPFKKLAKAKEKSQGRK